MFDFIDELVDLTAPFVWFIVLTTVGIGTIFYAIRYSESDIEKYLEVIASIGLILLGIFFLLQAFN